MPVARAVVVLVLALAAHGGLAPHALAQAPACMLVRVVDWPVRIVGTHIVVDGEIHGKKVGIMLDTGASVSALFGASATALGLPRRPATGRRVVGIGGEAATEVADVEDFRLGDARVGGVAFLVVGNGTQRGAWDLALGEDFLQRFDVEFDLAHAAVRLYQPRGCDGVPLAYWTKEAVAEVGIDPVQESRPAIRFPVEVNGRRIDALLDSGAALSVVPRGDAAAAGVAPESPGVTAAPPLRGVGARPVEVWVGTFASFAMGTERIADARIAFADVWKDAKAAATGSNLTKHVAPTQPMVVGADFLRAHRTLVAHSQRRIYFQYVGGPPFGPAPPAGAPRAN